MRSATMCSVLRSTASLCCSQVAGSSTPPPARSTPATWSLRSTIEGDYLGDLAEEEDDLGVRVSVPGVQWLHGFDF